MKTYQKKRPAVYIILHNIRSAYNIGAILRTADAVGVSKVYMTGYSATPVDRFGRARSDIAKAALGGELSVLWEKRSGVSELIESLKKEGVVIVGVEQAENTVDYKKVHIKKPTAFIFGNEVKGISKQTLSRCDYVAEIPMKGIKESLNVSVTVGVFLFRVLDI